MKIKINYFSNMYKELSNILKNQNIFKTVQNNDSNMNIFEYFISYKDNYKSPNYLYRNNQIVKYEDLKIDDDEYKIILSKIKEYEANYEKFLNMINSLKIDFDNMINNFKYKMQNIFDFLSKFNNNIIQINDLYILRIIFSQILNYSNEKCIINDKFNENKKCQDIINEFKPPIDNNKLKELLVFLKNKNFDEKITKIFYSINENNKIGSNFMNKAKNIYHISSGINNTTASSNNNHKNNSINQYYEGKKNLSFESNPRIKKDNKNDIKNPNNLKLIYERKKIRHQSIDNIKNHIMYNKIQTSINNTRITLKDEKKPKTNLNKSYIYDKKDFGADNKLSGIDLCNNSSLTIKGTKYTSNSIKSNKETYDNTTDDNLREKILKINSNNLGSRCSRNIEKFKFFNLSILSRHKRFHSAESNLFNDNINLNLITQKDNTTFFSHKRFITMEEKKNLKLLRNSNREFYSDFSKNNTGSTNNIFLNEINLEKDFNKNNLIKFKTFTGNDFNNNNKVLNISLELGNSECKIGFMSQKNNIKNINYCIIPTIISFLSNFNSKNKYEIKIGEEAKKLKITNPTHTIFNIIKIFGKTMNEIIGKKHLWPFKLYLDNKNNKPLIKLSKNQYYNFEELLTIFLEKVFQIFFNKLLLDFLNKKEDSSFNNNINSVNLNLNICVPNYFNIYQKGLIKKLIFSIFQKKFNTEKYTFKLNNLYISNFSYLPAFYIIDDYLNQKRKFEQKNYIILYIEDCSVNISVINIRPNINNYIIEVKSTNHAEFGEGDFLDNFINDIILNDINNIKSPIALSKIRNSINLIKDNFENNEDNTSKQEINIKKLLNELDINSNIDKNMYQKSCVGLFRKIIYLLKETIMNSNIKIKDINDIILLGQITQNIKLKKMMSELFKSNKSIYDKLTNNNKKVNNNNLNDYIIKGSLIQINNINMVVKKYKFINITNSSLWIETKNGMMDIIKKGSIIPLQINKFIEIKKNKNNFISLNIYERKKKNINNNKLILGHLIDSTNISSQKEDYVELLIYFSIDINNILKIYVLDKKSLAKICEFI